MHTALLIGAGLGVTYAVVAASVIALDRRPGGGSWINLSGLVSGLITFPITALAEQCGRRLDYRSNVDMTVAVAGTALLLALLIVLFALPFVA